MDKLTDAIKIGDTLTVKNDVFTIGGFVIVQKDQLVTIRDIEYTGGYWSRLCPDIYVPKTPSMVKLEGITGCWQLGTFKEFNHG